MKSFMIERDLSGSNSLKPEDLQRIAVQTNRTLGRLSPKIRWVQSFLSMGKSFCVVTMSETAVADFLATIDPANTQVREITATIDDSRIAGVRAVWTAMAGWGD